MYNSHFHNKIYKLDNEFDGCMRIAKPPRSYKASEKNFAKLPENSYTKNDVSDLISDSHFFAHKFCGESGLQAINLIKAKRT